MSNQLGLFDDTEPAARAVGPASADPRHAGWARRLPPSLRLGTSSWSFPGWAGLVYDRAVSERVLAREGLAAYGAHPLLRTVGLDRTYYRPISASEFRSYADAVPEDFRFLVKADRLLTSPFDPTPGGIRGRNPFFLDAAYATDRVVGPMLEGLGPKAGPLLLQFPPMSANQVDGPEAFAERLGRFLAALPRGPLYAVELRTPALLSETYVRVLQDVGAAHGHVVHPAMSPLQEQMEQVRHIEQPALVVRWMLHAGLRYEAARDRYEPFDRLVDRDEASLETITVAALDALVAERPVFIVVNNKAEGSSPLSVFRLAERLAHWGPEDDGKGATG